MAMATVSACSQPSSSFAPSNCNGNNNDALWDDIDLAERYLISSRFDEAAQLCSTVLRRLKELLDAPAGDHDRSEVFEMTESAGMALIQAYSESDRSKFIFNDLVTIFGSHGKIPPSIFLAGVCLQISARLYSDAQASIESFLPHWAHKSMNEDSCVYKSKGHVHFSLKPSTYTEIIDLYCVEVLTKGLGCSEKALEWLKDADIPYDKKQVIVVKVQEASLNNFSMPTEKTSLDHQKLSKVMKNTIEESNSEVVTVSESSNVIDESGVSKQQSSYRSLLSTLQIYPIADMFSSPVATSSNGSSQHSSKVVNALGLFSKKRATFGKAAMILLLIVFYKQRKHLARLFGGCARMLRSFAFHLYMGLYDFWQLAFNVQLNPLANVQQSRYIRG